MNAQRTLRRPVSCTGIGLHSGNKVTLVAEAGACRLSASGSSAPTLAASRFPRRSRIWAACSYADRPHPRSGLGRDGRAPARRAVALGIDNAIVELNSPEVPIMDGSAAPFVYLILNEAGVKIAARRRGAT